MKIAEKLQKVIRSKENDYTFSILIPTWNNIDYLKLCIRSIEQNSHFKHQIIVFVNEGADGSLIWLESQSNIDYIHSQDNLGICYAVNISRQLVKADYIIYMNDDMYVCPGWDQELWNEVEKMDTNLFYLSGTLIEPARTGNPSSTSIVMDYGADLESFNESKLLDEFIRLQKVNWYGASWPPSLISKDLWDLIGGFSIEFSPGMYSDPDFSMKLWKSGVRIFKGVGKSLIYHFGSKSIGKIKKNDGRDTFLLKWGITARSFYLDYLKMGQQYQGPLHEDDFQISILSKLKRMIAGFSN